ncbi:MAG: bifunctional diaminohydroxyphosphoribosylaminopyrimidine deaminase/5-amino-6-(5-phosphoribosylamino)uracil reductase RibD, partial [Vicinamibacterales bacterium]
TLYCTLEPCAHVGRTGPCAPRVADAGIRCAVVALVDPNPLVKGAGLAHLRARGVETVVGIEEQAARRQNAAFLTWILERRPFVIMKVALSVDGRVAAAPGVRTKLTGPAANRRIQRQRAEIDAIGVGAGTILADDPLLTARGAFRARPLTRVIFDRRLRTPPSARVLSTLEAGPVIIMTTERTKAHAAVRRKALEAAGATVLAQPSDDLAVALHALSDRQITSLVLEGGAALHRSAIAAGLVDLVQVYIAPVTLGPGGLEWLGRGRLDWDRLCRRSAAWLGDDVMVQGYVHGNH